MIKTLRQLIRTQAPPWVGQTLFSSYGRFWNFTGLTMSSAQDGMGAGHLAEAEFDLSGRCDADALQEWLTPDSVVLDLGCGVGRVTKHLALRCREVYAVDVSGQMLRLARRRMGGIANVHYQQTGGRDLRFLGDGSIDFAVAIQLFHMIEREDMMRYLVEIRRVLRPGGRVFAQFQDFEAESFALEFRDYALQSKALHVARRRFSTEPEVRMLGWLAGLDEIEVRRQERALNLIAVKPAAPEPSGRALVAETR